MFLELGGAHFLGDLFQTGHSLVADHRLFLQTQICEEIDHAGLELGEEEVERGELLAQGKEDFVLGSLDDLIDHGHDTFLDTVVVDQGDDDT